eukprot:360527-Chlamydomonas_euryale.AAC.2
MMHSSTSGSPLSQRLRRCSSSSGGSRSGWMLGGGVGRGGGSGTASDTATIVAKGPPGVRPLRWPPPSLLGLLARLELPVMAPVKWRGGGRGMAWVSSPTGGA